MLGHPNGDLHKLLSSVGHLWIFPTSHTCFVNLLSRPSLAPGLYSGKTQYAQYISALPRTSALGDILCPLKLDPSGIVLIALENDVDTAND